MWGRPALPEWFVRTVTWSGLLLLLLGLWKFLELAGWVVSHLRWVA